MLNWIQLSAMRTMAVYKAVSFLSITPSREQKVVTGFPQLMIEEMLHTDTSLFSNATAIVLFPNLHRRINFYF